MASTPAFLVVPFQEQLESPMGEEFEHITDVINSNFSAPSAPQTLTLQYTEFLPDPIKTELQSLVTQINNGFAAIAASTVALPVVLTRQEELKEPYLGEFLYLVGGINQGFSQLYP